ncbi:MAG: histidine--tRNA ligase [Actinobacteria bacterium]|nr:histidine--tRNA ligase [Actinomycetota bacterium]
MPDEPLRSEALRSPAGTHDVLWPESARWEWIVGDFAKRASLYGYRLLVTPVIEDARLFARGFGETSDVVGKEMYTFEDRGGRPLALRPEGTAPVVRSYIQHRPVLPWKVWYLTPAFRYERPQAGRYRQHHQIGVEALGVDSPLLDAEVIELAMSTVRAAGLTNTELLINSMGCKECRPAYESALSQYLAARQGGLCAYHHEHWKEVPLRVLDCKTEECRGATMDAPRIADHLCSDCRESFDTVLGDLDALGISYTTDYRLVRGFDYYTRTTFEIVSHSLDAAQNAIGGGGRYNGLVEALSGPPTPGMGFGIGMERLLVACDAEGCLPVPDPSVDVYVADLGQAGTSTLIHDLRNAGYSVERSYEDRSLKAQLRSAGRMGARIALIIGQREAAAGEVLLKPLALDDDQVVVARDVIVHVAGKWVERCRRHLAAGRVAERSR